MLFRSKSFDSFKQNYDEFGFDGGIYFTSNKEYLKELTINDEGGIDRTKVIMPVFLKGKNLMNLDKPISTSIIKWEREKHFDIADSFVGKDGGQKSEGNVYVVFESNQIKSVFNEGGFSTETGNIYKQTEEIPASRASEETVNKIKELAKSVGINFQDLLTYAKNNPTVDIKNATGLADLTKGIIALATGREDVAITEEFVHIATAIIEQVDPELITHMIRSEEHTSEL